MELPENRTRGKPKRWLPDEGKEGISTVVVRRMMMMRRGLGFVSKSVTKSFINSAFCNSFPNHSKKASLSSLLSNHSLNK